jgi:ADP-ribose pyrophosphatase
VSAKVNSKTTLYEGRVFKLLRENVTLNNGVTVDLDVIHHPGASAMIPMSGDDNVILIKQYRHAIGDFIWEIPAGTLDPDETPLECAKRELIEETGFSANTWQKLGEITPVPGYSNERIHMFLAADLVPAEQDLDKDEMLDVHEVSLGKAVEMIHEGAIQDSKTIAGLFMTTKWLRQRQLRA